LKSGYLSPGNSPSLNSILALKIFRDKIIADGGKNLYLTFHSSLFIIRIGGSDTAVHSGFKKAGHNKKTQAKGVCFDANINNLIPARPIGSDSIHKPPALSVRI